MNRLDLSILAIAVPSSLIIGAVLVLAVRFIQGLFGKKTATTEAQSILMKAREERRAMLLEAQEELLQSRRDGESELREQRTELRAVERRVANREENVEGRARNIEKREHRTTEREREIEDLHSDAEQLKERQVEKLESVADLSMDEAKEFIFKEKNWVGFIANKNDIITDNKIPTLISSWKINYLSWKNKTISRSISI